MPLILGLDIESTGIKVETDRIVEIALIMRDMDTWREKVRYVRRINPGVHIPPKVVAIHGISDADVLGCPDFKAIAPLLVKILEKADLVVGHNIEDFDIQMLIHELLRAGITKLDLPPLFDTMKSARGATADGKFPALGELCWAFDVLYDPSAAHSAAYDVDVTLDCYRNGVRYGTFATPMSRAPTPMTEMEQPA